MSQDYAFGQDVTRAFVTHLKKLRPDIEIVDQQWPKLGEADYTPFINAQMAKKPDAVFTSLWGGHFVTFVKQAKPLKYFEAVKYNVRRRGRSRRDRDGQGDGRRLPGRHLGQRVRRVQLGRRAAAAQGLHRSAARLPEGGTPVVVADHRLHRHADADGGDPESRQHRLRQSREGDARDLTVDTPIGKQTIRSKDHQANRAQFWGKMTKDPRYPFAVMSPPTYIDPAPFMD